MVGITSADPFPSDEEAAVERIREGRMDGLPWFTEQRVRQGTRRSNCCLAPAPCSPRALATTMVLPIHLPKACAVQ